MIESEIFKVAEAVMLDRNKFSSTDYEDLINAMKEKEKETASLLLPQFENFEGTELIQQYLVVFQWPAILN